MSNRSGGNRLENPRLERKNVFLENNILRQKTGLRAQIKQFIPFSIMWVTKENTNLSSRIKFSSVPSQCRSIA